MSEREPLTEDQTKLCALAVSICPKGIVPSEDGMREMLDGLVDRGNLETMVRAADGEIGMGREDEGEAIGYVASTS